MAFDSFIFWRRATTEFSTKSSARAIRAAKRLAPEHALPAPKPSPTTGSAVSLNGRTSVFSRYPTTDSPLLVTHPTPTQSRIFNRRSHSRIL